MIIWSMRDNGRYDFHCIQIDGKWKMKNLSQLTHTNSERTNERAKESASKKSFVMPRVWQLIKWIVMMGALIEFTCRSPQYANRLLFHRFIVDSYIFFFLLLLASRAAVRLLYRETVCALPLIPVIFCVFFSSLVRSLYHLRKLFALFFIKYLIEHAFLTMIMAIICVNHPIKS